MLKFLLNPSFLIPFSLITPYVFIGRTGVSFFEILVIIGFFIIFSSSQKIPKDNLIYIFMYLFLIGYVMSIFYSGSFINLNPRLGDLKIIYWLLISYSGFYLGYYRYQNIDKITISKVFKSTVIILAVLILSYPFLDIETKFLIMKPFYSPLTDITEMSEIYSFRFPGLGINANIYAFMLFILFNFSIYSWSKNNLSWLYFFLIFCAILVCGSKTVVALTLGSFIFFLLLSDDFTFLRKFRYLLTIILIVSSISAYVFISPNGQKIIGIISVLDRFSSMVESKKSPFTTRQEHWELGIERVKLSPFFGIKKPPYSKDSDLIGFCCPHNEFIAFWMFTGFLGMCAFGILIFGLVFKNFFYVHGLFWNLIYIPLIIQMFFDAAFQITRFLPLIFLIIGLNLREIFDHRISCYNKLKSLNG